MASSGIRKYGQPGQSSSTSISQAKFTVAGVKKTKSEVLLSTLNALGYTQPKLHNKPEHFDYLFQEKDRKPIDLIQKLTSKISNQNVVGKVEMAKIQKLKNENLVVYGKALETLVNRKKEERLSKEAQSDEQAKELEEIRRRIQQKKQNIQRLKNLEAKFIANEEKKKSEKSLEDYEKEVSEKKYQYFREEMLSKKSEQQEFDRKCVAKLQETLNDMRDPAIKSIDEFMERESKVESVIREKMKVKVDFDSDSLSAQPLSPFEICKTFEQYGKDFERLKHVIIYEIIQQIQNECKASCNAALSSKFDYFKKENERALRLTLGIQRKMIDEKMQSIEMLKKSTNSNVDKKLDQVRRILVSKFDNDIYQIQQEKLEAKKKIQRYYAVYADVLMKQFANLFVYDGLITIKNQQAAKFVNTLKQFYETSNELQMERRYLKSGILAENLSSSNQHIAKLFQDHGIPLEILRSPEATNYALSLIRLKEQRLAEEEKEKNEQNIAQKIQNLSKRFRNLNKQWKLNEKIRCQWNTDYEGVKILEENYKTLKGNMKDHILNKDKAVQEAIKTKEALLTQIKNALCQYNNSLAAKVDTTNDNRRSSMISQLSRSFNASIFLS